ncbi:hypothetical protein GQR58_020002 [Nymphon striatum]|nr:hypothetical protein GQR58_020002 [Nymphon striatum]
MSNIQFYTKRVDYTRLDIKAGTCVFGALIRRGIGGFIGGMLIHLFGLTLAFRGVGVFSAVVGIIYWLAHLCCFRKKYKRPSIEVTGSGIALTGAYYQMPSNQNNHSRNTGRQTNGYAKQISPSVVDDSDEEYQLN